MSQNIDAIYDQGVFRPTVPVKLPEGCRVNLRVEEQRDADEPAAAVVHETVPTLLERLKNSIGAIDDLPEDSSIHLDHYLYGAPKQ